MEINGRQASRLMERREYNLGWDRVTTYNMPQ